jgi:hypothetical protein
VQDVSYCLQHLCRRFRTAYNTCAGRFVLLTTLVQDVSYCLQHLCRTFRTAYNTCAGRFETPGRNCVCISKPNFTSTSRQTACETRGYKTVTIQNAAFWYVTPCNIRNSPKFRLNDLPPFSRLNNANKNSVTKPLSLSATSVNFYRNSRDSHINPLKTKRICFI